MIVHPYQLYNEVTPIDQMNKIEATLELCTLYKGLPYGPSLITYTDPADDYYSFRGVGVFNEGMLHNASFTCIRGQGGWGYSFSSMAEGRPADGSMVTHFCENEWTQHVDSIEILSDVSGWQYYSGHVNKEGRAEGQGREWDDDGSIYFGLWKNGKRTRGKKYVLEANGSHTLYQSKYNDQGKEIEKDLISSDHFILEK